MFIRLCNYVLLLSPLHVTFHLPLYNLYFTMAFGRFPFAYLVTFGEKEEKKRKRLFLHLLHTNIKMQHYNNIWA